LFIASRAVTVITVVPATSGTAAIDQDVVPVATPLAPALVVHVTCVTATLSFAVPLTASVPLVAANVPVVVGAVIAIVGAVASDAAGTVIDAAALQVPPTVFNVRIHQVAAPGANVTPGLAVQVPVPAPQPAAAAV
jgi:hypothetical protein